MRIKKNQCIIAILLMGALLFFGSPYAKGKKGWTRGRIIPSPKNKTIKGNIPQTLGPSRAGMGPLSGINPGGESESLSRISPSDRPLKGPVTSYSPEDREITIKDEGSYKLCKDVQVFYQTSTYPRRVSIINLETAEEARIFVDPRLSCVKEVIILKASR